MASGLLLDQDVDDLATVSYVDETLLVSILRCRFRKRKIYTAVGEILLSVNPFGKSDKQPKCLERSVTVPSASSIAPHISHMASRIYQNLLHTKRPQCCVFSGESGSGKTEASKAFLSHLMRSCKGENSNLEQRIIVVNPLLEAFGNAKTALNHNSSRFGKNIQLIFSENGHVVGARISQYLLEKSRVSHRGAEESNFHVFNTVMRELPPQYLRKLKLDTDSLYGGTNAEPASCGKRASSDVQSYDNFVNSLSVAGFSRGDQECIFIILATIICLGNIRFTEDPGGKVPFVSDTERFVKYAAGLLGIDKQNLRNQLQNLEIYSRGEIICRPYTQLEAEDCRDSISKALYNRLFAWLIHRINEILSPPATKTGSANTMSISLLDIFGFENLQKNSFEQLCINLANEQLQHFFNLKIFHEEQSEYEKEGLDVDNVAYRDNIDLLALFLDRPLGVLSLIDEESHFPQGSDSSLVTKFIKHFGSSKRFRSAFHPVPGQEALQPLFTICHYAGNVQYDATGFLEKNRDSLPDRISVLLQSSSHQLVSLLFRAKVSRTGSLLFDEGLVRPDGSLPPESVAAARSTRKRLTLGYQFKASLSALLEKLQASETNFVRCIKPNNDQIPDKFDQQHVLVQLRHAGILEAVWMRRQGFSYRPTFSEFMTRFRGLFNVAFDRPMTLIEKILEPYGCQSWHLGRTKVFVKYSVADDLASRIRFREEAARRIQRWFRRKLWIKQQLNKSKQAKNADNCSLLTYGTSDASSASSVTTYSDASRAEDYCMADAQQVSQWFTDCVYEQLASDNYNNVPSEIRWFFTNLTRKDAEALLLDQTVGVFLVRSSKQDPSILVLSFRAPERCRHYILDLHPGGKVGVRGEQELHSNLGDLLEFHRTRPISNYHGCLLEPYGFLADKTDNKDKLPAEYDHFPPNKRRSRPTKRKLV